MQADSLAPVVNVACISQSRVPLTYMKMENRDHFPGKYHQRHGDKNDKARERHNATIDRDHAFLILGPYPQLFPRPHP
jgi:hypothetical protein